MLASSVIFLSVTLEIGSDMSDLVTIGTRVQIVAVLGSALVVIEFSLLLADRPFSLGIHRQTPQAWRFQRYGPIGWGLDTGLPFTTFRYTTLTWTGTALLLLGFGSILVVPAYAGGAIVALIVNATRFSRVSSGHTLGDAVSAARPTDSGRRIRIAALLLAVVAPASV